MVGDQIRKIRECKGLSQQDLANKMGISRQTLSKIENGKQSVGQKMIFEAASALDIDYRVLVAFDSSQAEALLGDSVDRVNQSALAILDKTSSLKYASQYSDKSLVLKRMKKTKLTLIVFFSILIALESLILFELEIHNR
ncbi:MAG: helix-turn-helix domain-containing protein [Clostridiales bacterium]|nr:helix-turn-helix domain-containing protein [Clostridiales bacterium]